MCKYLSHTFLVNLRVDLDVYILQNNIDVTLNTLNINILALAKENMKLGNKK